MPDTRLLKHVETKSKDLNRRAPKGERTPAGRNRDVGQRKLRASSCPRPTHTECKPKATERISNKEMKAKQSETYLKATTRALKEQPKPQTNSHARNEVNR